MNGATASNSAGSLGATLGSAVPVNNPKRISITKLDNGFLLEMQKVDSYGNTNDVAVDLDGALKIANDYFSA